MPHLKVLHTSLEALNIHRGGIFLNSYRNPCDYQIYSLSLKQVFKILSFKNTQIYLAFYSLIRIFAIALP